MNDTQFKEQVMAAAKAKGLEEYELYCMETEKVNAEVLHHELNAFSSSSDAGACFRCVYSGRMGYAATERFTQEEAVRIVEAAMENASSIENDETAQIHASGDRYETVKPVQTPEPSAASLIALALDIQEQAYREDSRIVDGTQSFASFQRTTCSLCNSRGLDLSDTSAYSVAGCMAVAGDGDERFDGFERKAAGFDGLSAQTLAAKAVAEATGGIGAESVTTGPRSVVFSGRMTASLLATFFSVFSAESAQRGLSLLAGREDETIAAPLVTITDDPFREDSLIRIPFDSEGVATRRKHVVENGRLCTLLHNLSTAAKAGTASTGNGQKTGYASAVGVRPYSFYLNPGGAGTKEDLFQAMQNGIYVTELNGLHAGANPATGDFSLSAAGFLIEDGEKTRPVKNFTVSGNFYDLLKNIALAGDDLDFQIPRGYSCFGGPSILVKELAVAGK